MSTKVSTKISFGSLETSVESKLSFKPLASLHNGICLGKIIDVKVTEHEIPKQDENGVPSSWEFAGLKTYSLEITYQQILGAKDTAERFLTQRETIVSSGTKNGEPLDVKVWSSLIMQQYARLQHIVNALDKGGLTPKSKALGDIDIDYADAPELRIQKMKKFFEHFAKQIIGDKDKPRYKDVTLWIKVITDPVKGNFYVIPAFVGKGFMQVYKAGESCVLELTPSESIELVKKKKGATKTDMDYKDADANTAASGERSAADVLADLGIS